MKTNRLALEDHLTDTERKEDRYYLAEITPLNKNPIRSDKLLRERYLLYKDIQHYIRVNRTLLQNKFEQVDCND